MSGNFGLEKHVKTYSWRDLGSDLDKNPTYIARLAKERLPAEMLVCVGKHTKLRHEFREDARQILRDTRTKIDTSGNGQDGTPILSYSDARAARETYEAEYSRLKLEEKRAALLDAKEVQRTYTDAVARTHTRILQVPRQMCAELVGLEAGEIERLIEEALRAALKELQAEIRGVQLVEEDA